jgi:hypothetical protein
MGQNVGYLVTCASALWMPYDRGVGLPLSKRRGGISHVSVLDVGESKDTGI